MYIAMQGHDFHFELENTARLFLPHEPIRHGGLDGMPADGVKAYTFLREAEDASHLTVRLVLDDFDETAEETVLKGEEDHRDACELAMATLLYYHLVKLCGFTQSWGVLTGVRPVKLLRRLTAEQGQAAAEAFFRDKLLLSEEKMQLVRTTLGAENRLLSLSRPDSFSLYVSVPFCPTRCDYCSFVSYTVAKAKHLVDPYVELLCQEIRRTGEVARDLGLRLETVYFGGGTPTTLSAEQLTAVMQTVAESFDLSTVREYTVEAGRPDTVTEEKLRAIRAGGAGRVSINPQTLSDEVLETIGRRHTTAQFYDAYDLAAKVGFDCINTDLIAGLPSDTVEGFSRTLDGILALSPENVTVHTLSLKRASNLVVQHRSELPAGDAAIRMIAETADRLPRAGYHPYYLYRQSRMAGNQENVGWSKDGKDGLYNVYIMDETHTILGVGAGAVTKLKQYGTHYLERIFNYKFPYEYNVGLEEMLRRKESIYEFYRNYPPVFAEE